jgi:uncharacterized OB-fold protein
MFCKNCGNQIDDNTKFCPKCGNDCNTITSSQNQSTPKPLPSWRCTKCGEINKRERQICIGCGERKTANSVNITNNSGTPWYCQKCGTKNYGNNSYCSNCSCERITEWGTGAKVWFIICIIGGILGLISLLIMKSELEDNSMYQLYTAFGGEDMVSPMIFLIQCLYIAGYFILLKFKNKLGWFVIIAYLVVYMYFLFKNDAISFTTLISSCLNPLITGLVLRKYWSDLKNPSQLFNK